MARNFDPWDEFAWTTSASILIELGRYGEATRRAATAVERFPENVVARTGLGEVLKAAGRMGEAEAIYRQTVERFPADVVARNGLGEVLKAAGRIGEAEAIYRETVERFPADVVARNGLAGVLAAAEELGESSEQESYGDGDLAPPTDPGPEYPIGPLPSDYVAEPRSVYGLDAAGRESDASPDPAAAADEERGAEEGLSPAVARPDEAAKRRGLRQRDVEILIQDVYLLRRWTRRLDSGEGAASTPGDLRQQAGALLGRLVTAQEESAEAAGELGLLELDSGDLDAALELLRGAARRFPGSARVRYALARAERDAAEHQRRRLDPDDPEAPSLLWRRLSRLDNRFRPVQLLGEGRSWLVHTDGSFVEERARHTFGRLGYWMSNLPDTTGSRGSEFPAWWAKEVRHFLFAGTAVAGHQDVGNLDLLRQRNAQFRWELNNLEETWIRQTGRA